MPKEGTLEKFLRELNSSDYERKEEIAKITIKLPCWQWRSVAITIVLIFAALGMLLPIAAH